MQCKSMQSKANQCKTNQSKCKSNANQMQSNANQSKSTQCNAKQCNANQSKSNANNYLLKLGLTNPEVFFITDCSFFLIFSSFCIDTGNTFVSCLLGKTGLK